MRRYLRTFALILALAALCLGIWEQFAGKRSGFRESPELATNTLAQGTKSAISVPTAPFQGVKSNMQPALAGQPSGVGLRVEALRNALSEKNVPIDFFCRVLDQYSTPVVGASLKIYVRHWELTADAMSKPVRMEKQTDAAGNFDVHGVTGDGLSLEKIEKAGYHLSPKAQINYGPSSGTAGSPTIIRMWRDGSRESLVGGNKVFGITPDGRTYTIDLLLGRKIEGEADGDLRVSITRPKGISPREKYEWFWRIEAVKGGILETDDEFMYLAPEVGYESSVSMRIDPADSSWTPLVRKHLFIRSRDGKIYGRMQVEINAAYGDHGAIELNYTVNPNASRNLQP